MTDLITSEFSCRVFPDCFPLVRAVRPELFICSQKGAGELAPHMVISVDNAEMQRGTAEERLKAHLAFVVQEMKPLGVTCSVDEIQSEIWLGRTSILVRISGEQRLPKSESATAISMILRIVLAKTSKYMMRFSIYGSSEAMEQEDSLSKLDDFMQNVTLQSTKITGKMLKQQQKRLNAS